MEYYKTCGGQDQLIYKTPVSTAQKLCSLPGLAVLESSTDLASW